MVGFDTDWVTDLGGRMVTYSNLSPGEYRFEVEGTNNSGLGSVKPAVLYIEIRPAYWQTTWFWLLIGIAGSIAVWGSVLVRNRQLQEVEETRQQIADDLHDDFGSNLGAISFFLGRLSSKEKLTENDITRVGQYRITIERMLDDLHDVVWLSDPGYDDLTGLADRMLSTAQKLMQHQPFHFEKRGVSDETIIPLKLRRHLFLVYKEAVHNVVRHAAATDVQLALIFEKDEVFILIKDNGKGFDPELKRNGQGLKAMRRRAVQGEFDLTIKSEVGAGTSIEMRAKIA